MTIPPDEYRPNTRVSSFMFQREDRLVVASTGSWQLSHVFAKLAIEAAT